MSNCMSHIIGKALPLLVAAICSGRAFAQPWPPPFFVEVPGCYCTAQKISFEEIASGGSITNVLSSVEGLACWRGSPKAAKGITLASTKVTAGKLSTGRFGRVAVSAVMSTDNRVGSGEVRLAVPLDLVPSFLTFLGDPALENRTQNTPGRDVQKNKEANSISITDGGKGEVEYGDFSVRMTPTGGLGDPTMAPPTIYIFRNLPFSTQEAQRLGVKVGSAYLRKGNTFVHLRDVDLKLDDKALCVQFGVSAENSWHKTFWSVPRSESKKAK